MTNKVMISGMVASLVKSPKMSKILQNSSAKTAKPKDMELLNPIKFTKSAFLVSNAINLGHPCLGIIVNPQTTRNINSDIWSAKLLGLPNKSFFIVDF
jgi:hypothetical protein